MDIIITGVVAWFITQTSKGIIEYIKNKKIDWNVLIASGGMPSSHSAFVTATTSINYTTTVKEVCGHSFPQVIVGCIIGIITGLII